MGRWGELLFEGDVDLDEASNISSDAGIELFAYELDTSTNTTKTETQPEKEKEKEKEKEESEFRGKGLEATRAHLNSGVLHRLLDKYSAGPGAVEWDPQDMFVCKELRCVFSDWLTISTAALAMRVGATISPAHMQMLRDAFVKIRVSPKYSWPLNDSSFREPGKRQFAIALEHYRNDGTPYDFYAERCARAGCDRAQDELGEGEKLMMCARCREVCYCGKQCQKLDWKGHKKGCKSPEMREEEMRRKNAGRSFLSLNV